MVFLIIPCLSLEGVAMQMEIPWYLVSQMLGKLEIDKKPTRKHLNINRTKITLLGQRSHTTQCDPPRTNPIHSKPKAESKKSDPVSTTNPSIFSIPIHHHRSRSKEASYMARINLKNLARINPPPRVLSCRRYSPSFFGQKKINI